MLNEQGIALRGGHLCAQLLMNALDLTAVSRASIALYNNDNDIDALLDAFEYSLSVLR